MDLSSNRIYVRRSVWNGEEISVKTRRGYRKSISSRPWPRCWRRMWDNVKRVGCFKPGRARPSAKVTYGAPQPDFEKTESSSSWAPRLPRRSRFAAPEKRSAAAISSKNGSVTRTCGRRPDTRIFATIFARRWPRRWGFLHKKTRRKSLR
jgi:hypothetical protein